ncbi:MAG TPA: SdiA-regulated domain-containing protein [Chitinophagaceae bacterium]
MFNSKIVIVLLVLLKFNNYEGCGPDKTGSQSPPGYDLNTPVKITLPIGLDEISGISYYAKDSSVFAEIDEDGMLFKIYMDGSGKIKQWHYDKKHDFEDIVMHDSTFYLLISNGDIETLKFDGDSIIKSKSQFPDASKKANEFETLYYDPSFGLVMLCKNCEDDKKKVVTAFACKPDSSVYNVAFQMDVKPIAEKSKEEKFHFKPSAAAINPLTNELYILASVNKLLVVTDRSGNVKNVYTLDPVIFNQPEGITFTPWGDLLISNEKGEEDNATLLIFKPVKKK